MREKSPIIEVIKRTMPAVVSVVISKSVKALEEEIAKEAPNVLPLGNDKMEIPKEAIDAHGMVKIGGGSGFIVDKSGVILTNKHVIADSQAEYTIFLYNGEQHNAEVLARDPINDVAVLRIKSSNKNLPALKLGDSSKLELGQTVIAIGNALGLFKNTVSRGIISGLSRAIAAQADPDSPLQEMRGLIQTDAAINPGNSGGPLVNIFGEVIGINAAIVFGAQNIGFTIPINAAKRDLEDVRKFGYIKKPLLGLRYVTIDENLKEKMKLPVGYGALVMNEAHFDESVITDSPAHKAGIKDHDIILECNGSRITTEKTIQDVLENCQVGDAVLLKVQRKEKKFETRVVLAERK